MSSYFMAKKPLSSVQPPCLLIGSGFRNCPTAFWYVGDYHGLCLTSQIILRHERHDMSPKYPHSRHPITTTSYKERVFYTFFIGRLRWFLQEMAAGRNDLRHFTAQQGQRERCAVKTIATWKNHHQPCGFGHHSYSMYRNVDLIIKHRVLTSWGF